MPRCRTPSHWRWLSHRRRSPPPLRAAVFPMIVVLVEELAKTPYSALSWRTLLRIEVWSAEGEDAELEPGHREPLTLTPVTVLLGSPKSPTHTPQSGPPGDCRVAREPTSEMSEVVMDTDSTVGAAEDADRVAWILAALPTAAWIDRPDGRRVEAAAGPAWPWLGGAVIFLSTTTPRPMAVVNPMTDACPARPDRTTLRLVAASRRAGAPLRRDDPARWSCVCLLLSRCVSRPRSRTRGASPTAGRR